MMNNEKQKTIRYADLFGGVGGFRLGIERAINDKFNTSPCNKDDRIKSNTSRSNGKGWRTCATCVFYNDNDKYAAQTYNKNFKENWEATDIRTIKTKDIPEIDMLCGGFPCQAFSIAGKRRGFQDTRGTLFFEIARIIKAKRPKIIFLENVKGLLNHEKGKTFRTILQTISELGYNVQWMVLNSKFFGVPQNRERVFIIGSLRGECRPEILPFRSNEQEIDKERTVARTFTAGGHSGGLHSNSIGIVVKGYLNKNGWEKRNENIRRIYGQEGISPTIPTGQGGGVMNKIMVENKMIYEKLGKIYGNGDVAQAHRVYSPEGIITSQRGNTKSLIRTTKIRRLTPTECERLQGFPDGWTEGVSDTQRYKQMGNAVTVNVIEEITKKLVC